MALLVGKGVQVTVQVQADIHGDVGSKDEASQRSKRASEQKMLAGLEVQSNT